MKKCGKCKIEKNSQDFGVDKQKKDGLNSYCKSCIKKRSSKQREENTEYYKVYAGEYREKNREILRKKAWLTYYTDWDKRAEQSKKSYEKHKEAIALKRAEKRRVSGDSEERKKYLKKWKSENRSKIGKCVADWKKRNPQKAAAHTLVLWAVRSGVIKKSECCEECGVIGKVEGHHEDYFKPLEVKWVCKCCHSKKHRMYR